jgi:dipeptidyl aminopeptidase/acylaminoacyl peptidase
MLVHLSPARHVDHRTAPALLVHDPDDMTVPYDQSLLFAARLMEAARPVRFLPSPGSGHGFVYNPRNEWTARVWPVAVAWFGEHLLGESL